MFLILAAELIKEFQLRPGPNLFLATAMSVMLVLGWFRKHPEERARVLEPAAALGRCRPAGAPAG